MKGRGNPWRRAEWVVSLVHLSEYQAIPASATDKTQSPLLLPLSALLKIKSLFVFVVIVVVFLLLLPRYIAKSHPWLLLIVASPPSEAVGHHPVG